MLNLYQKYQLKNWDKLNYYLSQILGFIPKIFWQKLEPLKWGDPEPPKGDQLRNTGNQYNLINLRFGSSLSLRLPNVRCVGAAVWDLYPLVADGQPAEGGEGLHRVLGVLPQQDYYYTELDKRQFFRFATTTMRQCNRDKDKKS